MRTKVGVGMRMRLENGSESKNDIQNESDGGNKDESIERDNVKRERIRKMGWRIMITPTTRGAKNNGSGHDVVVGTRERAQTRMT